MRKRCPACNSVMIEIRKAIIEGQIGSLYPKFLDTYRGRLYHEYRFYCVKCKKEWVYNSLWRQFADVPENAAFLFDPESGLLKPNYACMRYFSFFS